MGKGVDKLKNNADVGSVSVSSDRDLSQGLNTRRYVMNVFGICRNCEWNELFEKEIERFTPSYVI